MSGRARQLDNFCNCKHFPHNEFCKRSIGLFVACSHDA